MTTARGGKCHARWGGHKDGVRVGEQPAAKPPALGGVSPAALAASPWSQPWHKRVPRSRSAAAAQTGNPPAAPSRWPPPPLCCGGRADGSETGTPPLTPALSPWGPLSIPRGCSGALGERAGGARRARGGHSRRLGAGDAHGRQIWGPARRGGGSISCEARPWQRPRARGDRGCYIKTNNAAVVPSLPSPKVGRARGASKLDNNCSHLLAHLRRGWEQRVPDPACRRRRACYGRDGEIRPPGEAGVGIPVAQG